MIRNDFVQLLRLKYSLPKREAELFVDVFFDCFKEGLAEEKRLTIPGFGQFWVLQRKPRTGRNPMTGQLYPISARKVVHFRPSKIFKDLLNQGPAGLEP